MRVMAALKRLFLNGSWIRPKTPLPKRFRLSNQVRSGGPCPHFKSRGNPGQQHCLLSTESSHNSNLAVRHLFSQLRASADGARLCPTVRDRAQQLRTAVAAGELSGVVNCRDWCGWFVGHSRAPGAPAARPRCGTPKSRVSSVWYAPLFHFGSGTLLGAADQSGVIPD